MIWWRFGTGQPWKPPRGTAWPGGTGSFARAAGFPLPAAATTTGLSREPEDLKQALLQGNGYVSYTPKGPGVSAQAAGCILGQTAPKGSPVHSEWFGLRGGDELRVITDQGGQTAVCPPGAARYWWEIENTGFSFCRFEVHRRFAAGSPLTLAMISNPIYFA